MDIKSLQGLDPYYFIEVDGVELDNHFVQNISDFSFQFNEEGMDRCEITIGNLDLEHIDDPKFQEGARYKVKWGYVSGMSKARTVVLEEVQPDFNSGSFPTITLKCYDISAEMGTKKRTLKYKNDELNIRPNEIATQIAERNGLSIDTVEADPPMKEFNQAAVTDIEVLEELAKQAKAVGQGEGKAGFHVAVHDEILTFKPLQEEISQGPSYIFEYYPVADLKPVLMSFTPNTNGVGSRGKAEGVKKKTIDKEGEEKEVERNTENTGDRSTSGDKSVVHGDTESAEIEYDADEFTIDHEEPPDGASRSENKTEAEFVMYSGILQKWKEESK